jgi:hypothetical protein
MTSVPGHATPLRFSERTPPGVDPDCPPAALADASWLGAAVDSPRPETRRYLTDLSLPVREHSPAISFSKAALVDLGVPRRTRDGWEVEIGWRSSSLAPLFPVFAGRLTVTAGEVTLAGYYAPPGGDLGAALDRSFLNIAARGTARWFLGRVCAALACGRPAETGATSRDSARQAAPSRAPGAAPGDATAS